MIEKISKLYKKYEELVNYVIVGGCTTVVSLATKWGLLFTVLSAKNAFELQVANVVSWIASVTFAYITNRLFVFKTKNAASIKEASKFYASRVFTLLLEMLVMWFFITFLKMDSNMWVMIWTLVCQVLNIVLNYITSKFIVFIKRKD